MTVAFTHISLGGGLFVPVPTGGTSTVILGGIGVTVSVDLVGQTVQGITKTALYVSASERTVPPKFDNFDFETLDGRAGIHSDPIRSISLGLGSHETA